ncbi:MAG: glycosyltransferase family 1 protein [Gluconobacter oxydans]|uniref:glycosyltransferase family 4 protein n=1 Tax=Gluconobacter oxydans TaxID=442 RepID=UPI0039ED1059
MTLWIDIDDLLHHLLHHSRPSGIQRVVFEIGSALRNLAGHNVQFVRRGPGATDARDFRTVDWTMVETVFREATNSSIKPGSSSVNAPPLTVQALEEVAPEDLLPAFFRTESRILKSLAGLPRTFAQLGLKAIRTRMDERRPKSEQIVFSEGTHLADVARPGDVFLTLGAPWHHQSYIHTVRWVRDELRMSFALLMHDLVPIRCPEWCDRGVILTFRSWHQDILPLADMIFANSYATAKDVQAYLAELNIGTDIPVHPIPLGTGFGLSDASMTAEPLVREPYVLFVSTIEARKNHPLLFRVWRQMLEDMPADRVPTLVFAGREGWLVSDFMQQLENTDWLNGKIRFIQNPTDEELRRLYADCSFTVFPSFFEGWGLPVTESLSMGRPCVVSNTTSIPEAGGPLGRYFSPYSLDDAYTVIRETIEDPEGLAAWTAKVRAEFRPVPWEDSARAILDRVL